MGSATISRSDALEPSINFLDTVTAAMRVTVSGCSGGTNINANVSLKILSKYFDSNGAYITGGDKTATLGSQSKSGTGFVDLTYQHANYNAGLWVAGNRPSGAVKAKYHYVSSVGGYSPCPASVNDSHDGPDSDWVVW